LWGTSIGGTFETRQLGVSRNLVIHLPAVATLLDPLAAAIPLLVDTGRLTTRGLDAAAVDGPVSVAAEHLALEAAQHHAAGWTASAAWVLTGQRRTYRQGSSAFAGFQGLVWPGAVELSTRFSDLAVDDSVSKHDRVIALNWYANAHSRFAVELAEENVARPTAQTIRRRTALLRAQFKLGSED
jgi:phosphate-selective porin